MFRFLLAAILSLLPLSLASCDKAYMATMEKMGYAKRDILSTRVKSARDAQEDAKQEIQTTLEQFGKVVAYEGGDLEATYKKLNGELENSEDSAEAVRKNRRRERGRRALFRMGNRTRAILQRRPPPEESGQAHSDQGPLPRDAGRHEAGRAAN